MSESNSPTNIATDDDHPLTDVIHPLTDVNIDSTTPAPSSTPTSTHQSTSTTPSLDAEKTLGLRRWKAGREAREGLAEDIYMCGVRAKHLRACYTTGFRGAREGTLFNLEPEFDLQGTLFDGGFRDVCVRMLGDAYREGIKDYMSTLEFHECPDCGEQCRKNINHCTRINVHTIRLSQHCHRKTMTEYYAFLLERVEREMQE